MLTAPSRPGTPLAAGQSARGACPDRPTPWHRDVPGTGCPGRDRAGRRRQTAARSLALAAVLLALQHGAHDLPQPQPPCPCVPAAAPEPERLPGLSSAVTGHY